MPFKKGQSGNKNGRPKGAVSACTRAKADYFAVYEKLGGRKWLLKYMSDNRQLWPDFVFKVLPGLMPKRTEDEGQGTGKGITIVFNDPETGKKSAGVTFNFSEDK